MEAIKSNKQVIEATATETLEIYDYLIRSNKDQDFRKKMISGTYGIKADGEVCELFFAVAKNHNHNLGELVWRDGRYKVRSVHATTIVECLEEAIKELKTEYFGRWHDFCTQTACGI